MPSVSASCRRSSRIHQPNIVFFRIQYTIIDHYRNRRRFSEQIIVVEWQHVAFLILLVLVTVAVIDYLSRWLRAAIIGKASTM
jgi:ABC-type phosphate/phosphonate transport system permease subunit